MLKADSVSNIYFKTCRFEDKFSRYFQRADDKPWQADPPSEQFTFIGHISILDPLGGKDFRPPSEQETSPEHISALRPLGDLQFITKSSYVTHSAHILLIPYTQNFLITFIYLYEIVSSPLEPRSYVKGKAHGQS